MLSVLRPGSFSEQERKMVNQSPLPTPMAGRALTLERLPQRLSQCSPLSCFTATLRYKAKSMLNIPRASDQLARYEEHIYRALNWDCSECGAHVQAAADIRKEEESQAPDGPWALRKAREAMDAGWYLPPLEYTNRLPILFCVCPACAAKLGLSTNQKHNQAAQTTPG